MAFWRHSAFPRVLCGTITRMRDNGSVETEEFGKGSYFKPIKILPLAAGLAIKTALRELETGHRQRIDEIEREFSERVRKLIKEDP